MSTARKARKVGGEFVIKIGLVFLFLMFVWSLGAGVGAGARIGEGPYKTVCVSRGDTVWSLAAEHGDDREDIRNIVIAIRKLNRLASDAQIYPGQTLKIPQPPR